ncbi:hypothetical protein, partial [Roseateles sp. P5_E1]
MKFTDGQWMHQPGVAAHYAAEAYAIEVHEDRLVVLATTRPIKHRGDTLQGPTLTVTLSSPLPGVIRVSVEHYAASSAPRLHIPMPGAGKHPVQIDNGDTQATLTSGAISVDVKKGEGWSLTFREGDRVLTKSDWRGLGFIQWAGKDGLVRHHVHDQLSLGVGENVYGLGERFTFT